jgi:hypothetical protein
MFNFEKLDVWQEPIQFAVGGVAWFLASDGWF